MVKLWSFAAMANPKAFGVFAGPACGPSRSRVSWRNARSASSPWALKSASRSTRPCCSNTPRYPLVCGQVSREKSPLMRTPSVGPEQSRVHARRRELLETPAQQRGALRLVQIVVGPQLGLVIGAFADLTRPVVGQPRIVMRAVARAL